MSNINQNSKKSLISYKDGSGKKLEISNFKNEGVKFTVHHDEVIEGYSRKEYEIFSLPILPESGNVYRIAAALYEKVGNQFVFSNNPIIDKNNYMYIEQNANSTYFMNFGRDLSNGLKAKKLQYETRVVLEGKYYIDMVKDALIEPVLQASAVLASPTYIDQETLSITEPISESSASMEDIEMFDETDEPVSPSFVKRIAS